MKTMTYSLRFLFTCLFFTIFGITANNAEECSYPSKCKTVVTGPDCWKCDYGSGDCDESQAICIYW